MSDLSLDTSGLLCPMPVIKTQDKIATMQTGDTLEVTCTDPGALHDIPAWCRISGHEILHVLHKNQQILLKIQIN